MPDRRYVSFMYSYPNLIPASAESVRAILASVEPYFGLVKSQPEVRPHLRKHSLQAGGTATCGTPTGGKAGAVRLSAERYITVAYLQGERG